MNLLLTIIVFIGLKIQELFLFIFKIFKNTSIIISIFGSIFLACFSIFCFLGMLEVHVIHFFISNKMLGTIYQLHSFPDFILNLETYIIVGMAVTFTIFFLFLLSCLIVWGIKGMYDNLWEIKRFFINNWEEAKRIVNKRRSV